MALPPRTTDTMSDAIAMGSPSGRRSKRAQAEQSKKLSEALFCPGGLSRADAFGDEEKPGVAVTQAYRASQVKTMLTPDQQKRLAALRHVATRYEVVLHHERYARDAETPGYLLGYTRHRSKRGLLALIRTRSLDVVAFVARATGATEDNMTIDWDKRLECFKAQGGFLLRFSGRTLRDAIQHGELEELPLGDKQASL